MTDESDEQLVANSKENVIGRTPSSSSSAESESIYIQASATHSDYGIESDSLKSCTSDPTLTTPVDTRDMIISDNDQNLDGAMNEDDVDKEGPGEGDQSLMMEQENDLKIIPPPASWYLHDNKKDEADQRSPEVEQEVQIQSSASNHETHCIPSSDKSDDKCVSGPNNGMQQTNAIVKPLETVLKRTQNDGSPHKYTANGSKTSTTKLKALSPSSKTSKAISPRNALKIKSDSAPSITIPSIEKGVIQHKLKVIQHVTTNVLPSAAQELVSSAAQKAVFYTRLSYSNSRLFGKFHLANTEVGNRLGGYNRRAIIEEGIRDANTKEILWKESMLFDPSSRYSGGQTQSLLGQQPNDSGVLVVTSDSCDSENGNCTSLARKDNETTPSVPSGLGWEDEWDKARIALPPFSSLPWVDRQLVKEWRTCDFLTSRSKDLEQKQNLQNSSTDHMDDSFEEEDFEQARTLLPQPIQKPPWENASSCYACRKMFGSMLRHHCRLCGRSYCQSHSRWTHKLPHLGYSPDVPERVCAPCKQVLESQNLAERIAWRMARCRDYLSLSDDFVPYFDTGLDTVEDAAVRLTKAAIHMAKSIPLGAQATMTVETLDILRKHGLKGVYGLVLRKEFLAAADLLCKVTGINKKVWPLSVHELSAAIFYALAQHRALRGVDPGRENRIHALRRLDDAGDSSPRTIPQITYSEKEQNGSSVPTGSSPIPNKNVLVDDTDDYDPYIDRTTVKEPILPKTEEAAKKNKAAAESQDDASCGTKQDLPFDPVCDPVSDMLLSSLIFYAPLALNFIYATSEVDMQLLAAQQGWRLLYAHLKQDDGTWGGQLADKPASALFVHSEQKIACFAVRGTATINDVVTDIRAMPIQFPEAEMDGLHKVRSQNEMNEDGWTNIVKGQGLALCGMAGAACNLFRENIDAILLLARQGYKIRLTGHSMGGSCAALLGSLIKRHFEFHLPSNMFENADLLKVYSYGSPACVDAKLADYAKSYVVNCVLHDDVIPRLTPTSIRALLKHLLYIRETWVKTHLNEDLMAITERAKTVVSQSFLFRVKSFYSENPFN